MQRISTDRQRELIDELGRLIAERAQSEVSIRSSYEARDVTTNTNFATERERLTARFTQDKNSLQSQHNNALATITRDYETSIEQASAAHDQTFRDAASESEAQSKAAKDKCELLKQRAKNAFEESVRDTKEALTEFKSKLETYREELRALESRVDKEILRKRWCSRLARQLPAATGVCDSAKPIENYAAERAAAQQLAHSFRRQWAPKLLAFPYLMAMLFVFWIGLVVAAFGLDLQSQMGIESQTEQAVLLLIATGGLACGLTAIVWVLIRQPAVRQTLDLYRQFQQRIANADTSLDAARALAVAEADQKRELLRHELDRELIRIEREREAKLVGIRAARERRMNEASELVQKQRAAAVAVRDQKQAETNRHFEAQRVAQQSEFEQRLAALETRHQQELATSRETFERAWQRLVQRWRDGVASFQDAIAQMNDYCAARFPDWKATDWREREPLDASLPALRFGHYGLRLDMFDGGLSTHPDLLPSQTEFALPAVMSFAEHPALLFEAFGAGRSLANRAIQNVMLRLVTSLPPGKVRFTIIDPVGLGQNFSAFMHLADFDEKLVTHRIWTEEAHITQRLADLTEHMEGVIQTYLRNEFKTIDDYNAFAGEVAEPFHILVAANFPAGFNEEAAQRLLSIVASGAKCGVYSLIGADSKLDLPRNFNLADLEANAAAVQWDGHRFRWLEDDLKDLPLELDEPPADEDFTDIVRTVGQRAKDAIRVEVPFRTVAPNQAQWWTQDSRGGIDVALGRAGATKLQHLNLGKGTSQHVLISGKTGSGKSTLLHAMIANTALHYSPEEVQFYLVDFKKGVEFKPYATHHLPHARVVAIESEREFGMSVLERLDLELKQRGDLFREHGVQDVKSFRDANPQAVMPRILLVIDEFQEFFVQDDNLAQDAGLLLDRLVRQGRAFGIHVLLGSQTLAGAYSLARSTIGQMAVRIALQCSEADSHLILSEDNTAARLLNRPGEAIYNDANGLFEGNHPFQVVWLSANEQESLLQKLSEKSSQARLELAPSIVFEGNAPADPFDNSALRAVLQSGEPATALSPTVWLGAAVSIKEPTSAVLRRQSGANLLVVGQQEEMAMGVMGNAVVSLAATSRETSDPEAKLGAQFFLLDGSRADAVEPEYWQRIAESLPISSRFLDHKNLSPTLLEITTELKRRVDADEESSAPVFLVVYNLSRFRELRRADDDFGFSSFDDDKPASASQLFVEILRDGPPVGIHTIVWCDTFNNLNRWLDRQTLRELDFRVLFQMSATDSSNLMDSPVASRLGTHRAILFSEEQGEFEKFRPYAPASPAWLDWVRSQLQGQSVSAPLT